MATWCGPDRRRNRLYVTQNTEYHLSGRKCVAVRDLWSGAWLEEHPAVGKALFGAVMPSPRGLQPLDDPAPGALLWFENGDDDILTSRLTALTRAPRRAVERYVYA